METGLHLTYDMPHQQALLTGASGFFGAQHHTSKIKKKQWFFGIMIACL